MDSAKIISASEPVSIDNFMLCLFYQSKITKPKHNSLHDTIKLIGVPIFCHLLFTKFRLLNYKVKLHTHKVAKKFIPKCSK